MTPFIIAWRMYLMNADPEITGRPITQGLADRLRRECWVPRAVYDVVAARYKDEIKIELAPIGPAIWFAQGCGMVLVRSTP